MKPDFSRRSDEAEWMDTLDIGFEEFHHCLRELERINMLTLAYRPTLLWLRRMLAGMDSASILDVGSGGGDMLRRIWRWNRGRTALHLTGVDMNPWAKRSAELSQPQEMDIEHETANIFALKPDRRPDFIISSLFTHHLSDDELVRFLRWMETHAQRGWLINDLHRHPIPYYFIRYATHLFSHNRLIRHDSYVSVARAFTRRDWRRLLAEAQVPPEAAIIRWHVPFRYSVERRIS